MCISCISFSLTIFHSPLVALVIGLLRKCDSIGWGCQSGNYYFPISRERFHNQVIIEKQVNPFLQPKMDEISHIHIHVIYQTAFAYTIEILLCLVSFYVICKLLKNVSRVID